MICLDELGPLRAKTYRGRQWSKLGQPPRLAPDYGKRSYTWVFGAFEPASGQAITQCQQRRATPQFLELLDAVVAQWQTGELVLILDNLSIHRTVDVQLWAVAHPRVRFLFQPTYTPWLNLIEPGWKTLRKLALHGRRFDTLDSLRSSIVKATDYWNDHRQPYRWRKKFPVI